MRDTINLWSNWKSDSSLVSYLLVGVGPWFVGEVLAGHVGACFVFGFFVNGTFVPTVLTYVYGAAQVSSDG